MKNLIKNKANKLKKLKAFTLIEMLIVIVIIGILAAALIPKLNSARGRANDTARKADVSQIMAGLISVQIDKGQYPQTCGELSLASGLLLKAGLNEVPVDPDSATLKGMTTSDLDEGQYGYCAISKNGQDGAGALIMAIAETEGAANYVTCLDGSGDPEANHDGIDNILDTTTYSSINKCLGFTTDVSCGNMDGDKCGYDEGEGELRYIYTQ